MSKTLSAEAEHKPYFTTKRMALIGVMTAVTCILGPFSIPLPFSPVPISFTNLAIYLAAYVLGMKVFVGPGVFGRFAALGLYRAFLAGKSTFISSFDLVEFVECIDIIGL